jgi:hypothetical protein
MHQETHPDEYFQSTSLGVSKWALVIDKIQTHLPTLWSAQENCIRNMKNQLDYENMGPVLCPRDATHPKAGSVTNLESILDSTFS